MLRDQGPRYNLGFGMPMQPTDKGTGGDHSNAVQKALDGHPVMRFFAVAGASILSMGLAGQVVRGGGLRLAEKIQMAAQVGDSRGDFLKEGIKSFRKIESLFDDV